MRISMIAALGRDRVIGQNNRLLWSLPNDMQWFKALTLYKPVIMGRKTYQSLRGPLANRTNIVISHHPLDDDRVIWANSKGEALAYAEKAVSTQIKENSDNVEQKPSDKLAKLLNHFRGLETIFENEEITPEVMIIGGEAIYREFLVDAEWLYLTHVNANLQGDVFFPDYSEGEWRREFSQQNMKDDKHAYDYRFELLKRRHSLKLE